MTTQSLSVRDIVVLHTPDSPGFDGLLAEVVEVKDWGAMVCIRAVHVMPDGKRTIVAISYRALWEEVDYIGPLPPEGTRVVLSPIALSNVDQAVNSKQKVYTPQPVPSKPRSPHVERNGQYQKGQETGNYCPKCGGSKMIRSGSCVKCQDCHHNEGCAG